MRGKSQFHTFLLVGALMAAGILPAGYAQVYYFGLRHDTSGPVMLFPQDGESILVEGLPDSPEAGLLQISAGTGPTVQLDGGLSVSLWSMYWGPDKSLIVGAGSLDADPPAPVYLLQIAPGPSPDITALSVVLWDPQSGYLYQPMTGFGTAGPMTDAVYLYLPPAELFSRLSSAGALYPRTRLAIGNPGLTEPVSGSHARYQIGSAQKGGIADNPQFTLVFGEPVYGGVPGTPPSLMGAVSFYLPGGQLPLVSPLVLAAAGDGGLVLVIEQEAVVYQGLPVSFSGDPASPGKANSGTAVRGALGNGTLQLSPAGDIPGSATMTVTVPKQTQGATFGERVNAGISGIMPQGGTLPGGATQEYQAIREGGRTIGAGQVTEIIKLVNRPDGSDLGPLAGIRFEVLDNSKGNTGSFDVILKNGGANKSFQLPVNIEPGRYHLYITGMSRPPRNPERPYRFSATGDSVILSTDGQFMVEIGVNEPGVNKSTVSEPAESIEFRYPKIDSGMPNRVSVKLAPPTGGWPQGTAPATLELYELSIAGRDGELPFRKATQGGFFEIGESVCLEPPDAPNAYNFTWYKDGQEIPGATGSSLCLSELTPGDSGVYRVAYETSSGEKAQAEYFFHVNVTSSVPVGGGLVVGLAGLALMEMGIRRIRKRRSDC